MRVLFVEDNQEVAETVSLALKSRGHRCRCLMTGAPAVPLAKDEDFDIVVLDIDLPDLSGCEVLDKMRAEGVQTPVLLQSGLPDSELPATSQGDDFLYKPFSIDQLVQRMEAAIEKGRSKRAEDFAGDLEEEPAAAPVGSAPPEPVQQPDSPVPEPQAAPEPEGAPEPQAMAQVSKFALPPTSAPAVPPDDPPDDPGASAPAEAPKKMPAIEPAEAAAPPEEEKGGAERRRHERHDTFGAAVITDNGRHIACAVRNISESGAALRLANGAVDLPDEFILRQLDGPEWRCQLRWREGDRVGVEFLI